MLKRAFLKFISLLCVLSLIFSLNISAAEEYPDGLITINKETALNGDSVVFSFTMSHNPGIMAMTISITYDSSALEYEKYSLGCLRDYTVAAHPAQNIVRFVSCDPRENNYRNDVMFSMQFKVKEDADFGFYPIDISYSKGDFCDEDLKKLMPTVKAGGVEVEYNGTNCSHKGYGEWKEVAAPACLSDGIRQRKCLKCPHTETASIAPVGHDFERAWTIDKAATKENSGIMSRHCTRCAEVTDTITYSLEQSEQLGAENKENAVIKPNDFTNSLVEEQLPEVFEQNGGTALPPEREENEKNDNSIIGEIEKNSTGRIAKIIEAIPNFEQIKNLLSAAVLFLIRLLLF